MFIGGLVKMVEGMIPEDAETGGFDASKWVARWLDQPQRLGRLPLPHPPCRYLGDHTGPFHLAL